MGPTGTYVIELSDRENTSWRFYVPARVVGESLGAVVDAYLADAAQKGARGVRVTIDPIARPRTGR
jgi:hypothetical protein